MHAYSVPNKGSIINVNLLVLKIGIWKILFGYLYLNIYIYFFNIRFVSDLFLGFKFWNICIQWQ